MTVGEKIKVLRDEKGLSRGKLAELADVSYNTIKECELGKRKPRKFTLELIAAALGVGVDELREE